MIPLPPPQRQFHVWVPFRYLGRALSGIGEDVLPLLKTKTATGAIVMLLCIICAAVVPPLQWNTATRPATVATNAVSSASKRKNITVQAVKRTHPALFIAPPKVLAASVEPLAQQPLTQRGVFLTASSMANERFRTATLDHLQENGGNALIFDAKGSVVEFDADNTPLAKSLGLVKPWYTLQEIVPLLHDRGIYAIARFIAIKDYGITKKVPSTQIEHPRYGNILSEGWIDPADPVALEYNREVICELAKYGVDEINLDYIRYDTKVSGRLEVFSEEDKIERIGAFIKMARNAIDECGPDTKLGVSTFAILGWDYEKNLPSLGQDIVRFAPMLDVISPMAYNANFSQDAYNDPTGKRPRWNYLVYRTLIGYAKLLGPEHAWKLRPWLQGFYVDAHGLEEQMQGVFDAGACGFLIWNADNSYASTYAAMKNIEVPERCNTII